MVRDVAAVLVIALSCGGCSGLSSTETDSSASKSRELGPAANGPKIRGTGYVYNVPKGWGLPPQDVPEVEADSHVFNLRDTDGFADNVNVVLSPSPEASVGELEGALPGELAAMGFEDVTVAERVTVAGEETAHVSGRTLSNGKGYQVEQFYLHHDDDAVVVTFSFSRSVKMRARTKVTDAVLASWHWRD